MDLARPFPSKAARNISPAPAPLALPGPLRRDAGRTHFPITRTPVPAHCSPQTGADGHNRPQQGPNSAGPSAASFPCPELGTTWGEQAVAPRKAPTRAKGIPEAEWGWQSGCFHLGQLGGTAKGAAGLGKRIHVPGSDRRT